VSEGTRFLVDATQISERKKNIPETDATSQTLLSRIERHLELGNVISILGRSQVRISFRILTVSTEVLCSFVLFLHSNFSIALK
jgi:hypothetical protein